MLEPKKPGPTQNLSSKMEQSLSHPVADLNLSNLVKPGTTAGVLIDPIVPPGVQKQSTETIKAKLSGLGIEKLKLFFRRRTSNVEPSTVEENGNIFRFRPDDTTFTELGKTSFGTDVYLETELLNCDIKILVGMVTPHFSSGFTGGPDILLPGASSLDSITKNRSLMIKSMTGSGNLGENPVLLDSFEVLKMAGTIYSVAFVPDGWGGIDTIFSGDVGDVFRTAVARYMEVHGPKIDRKSDVVVMAAGKLLGMDLYHGVRVLANALAAVKREGTVILVSECSRGIGDQAFLEYSRRFSDKKELVADLRHKFRLGSHVSLFLQEILEKQRVQLVSVLPDLYARDCFRLKPSRTASASIQQAIRIEGKDAKVLVVSRGDLTIPTVPPA